MSASLRLRDLVPRRAAGLPPGQREVRVFPRFSDKPLRPAPPPAEIDLVVSIDGEEQTRLSAADLAAFEPIEQVSDFHCVTTWTYRGLRWGGVRLADVLASVADALPPYAVAHTADGLQAIFVKEDLLHDAPGGAVLLATHLDGAPLDAKHGAPLRLVSPHQYGYKNPKHLTRLDFRTERPASMLGPKEHLRGRVALEERHARLPNWAVRVPYRLLIAPTAIAGERGLRKSA